MKQSWFSCCKWVVIRAKLPAGRQSPNIPKFSTFQHSFSWWGWCYDDYDDDEKDGDDGDGDDDDDYDNVQNDKEYEYSEK